MRFQEHYFKEIVDCSRWREKMVWYITPVQKRRSRIKIGNLPPKEMEKHRPSQCPKRGEGKKEISKSTGRKGFDGVPSSDTTLGTPEQETLTFYIGVKDAETFDQFEEDVNVLATDIAEMAIDLEDKGYIIVRALNVPVEAVKKYKKTIDGVEDEE